MPFPRALAFCFFCCSICWACSIWARASRICSASCGLISACCEPAGASSAGAWQPRAQEVLDFWFGRADPLSPPHFAERLHLWFGGDDPPEIIAERDETIARQFRRHMDEAAAGALDHWAGSPHRLLALVLLLDQFPRHVYRGRARAYAQDHRAMAFAMHGVTTGADAALTLAQRLFLYLPLQHAESASMQEESIAAYRRLLADSASDRRGCSGEAGSEVMDVR